jgi:quercetin dioxygenase-like cupin family protein
MTVIRGADARRTKTPNAVMTTLASPTQGGARQSLWRVEMGAGQIGPEHAFDVEQVWTLLSGCAMIELGGEATALAAGDTVVLPAAASRRVHAGQKAGFSAIVTAPAGARATLADGTDKGVPDWIA